MNRSFFARNNAFETSDGAILARVTALLAQDTASQRRQLCQFLREQPTRVPLDSLLPKIGLRLKLELIEELHNRLRKDFGTSERPFHFSNIQIAALCLMSVETLQDLRQDATSIMSVSSLHYQLSFLVNGKFPPDRNIFASMATHIFCKTRHRHNEEHEKCLLRDQRLCVLTKSKDVAPCYIASVGLTKSQMNIDDFTDSRFLRRLVGDDWVQISRILAIDSIGAFGKSWNMLCLDSVLCEYWAQCLFGLKYLEMATNDDGSTVVQIQFHWMPINELKPHQRVEPPYDRAIDAMLQTTTTGVPEDGNLSLKSGDSFSVTINSKEEALKMKAALGLQWLAVRLAALSGTSKEWEYDSDSDIDEASAVE
ncbi:hypothetical protein J3E69DRAFT_367021 [Trichoderma sp. SZMC 28015]